MITMTLAVVPNKIRARSRRLRHVVHEQRQPSFVVVVGGGVVVVYHIGVESWWCVGINKAMKNGVFFPFTFFPLDQVLKLT